MKKNSIDSADIERIKWSLYWCHVCFYVILVRALNCSSKSARENCVWPPWRQFQRSRLLLWIYKRVLCATTPDQKDKTRCTFPVIWLQGSCLIKVDNVSGSSHGNLSSDPYCSVVSCNESAVVDNCPIPWSMGTSHQAAHTSDSNVKQFTKIWNALIIYLFSVPKDN